MNPQDPESPSLRWLSRDYAELRTERDAPAIDVLIVGSGYGGAMAAVELAGKEVLENGERRPLRVVVLERGREYAPGMFASSLQDLPPHVRVHRGGQDKTMGPLEALLDVRAGEDVCALVGNGLGGGSLINAGVMEVPRLDDCDRLPPRLRAELTPELFAETRAQLGASTQLHLHPKVPAGGLAKTQALHQLGCDAGVDREGRHVAFRPAAITVQVQADPQDPDVPPCTLCGDCMTGCNVGAKKSLDTTLLRQAWRQGAQVYTGGSVLKVRRDGERWSVNTVYTDEALRRRHQPAELRARHVILAAGTLGSTEILLRSRGRQLPLSERLGEQFSCNGDNLVALHDGPAPVHTTCEESVPLRDRQVGPTITGVLDLDGMLLQEFAVPAPLKRLFDETVTTSRLLHDLGKPPTRSNARGNGCDSFGVDGDAMERTLLVGLIAHDESCGQLKLEESGRDSRQLEGRLRIHWPGLRKSFMLERGYDIARGLVQKARGTDAPFLPNPLWRLLPPDMDFLVQGERGPALTVHPLGGCPMGENWELGVVDDLGRVFDPVASRAAGAPRVHEGLVVLDGSVIPASLGANPALMIATVAKRASRRLAAEWGFLAGSRRPLRQLRPRPVFRPPEHCTPGVPRPTEVELAERLIGRAGDRLVELTLRYKPMAVTRMMAADRPSVKVDPEHSFVRIYPGDEATRRQLITWPEARRDDRALLVARVGGELDMLQQLPGSEGLRMWRAAWHWFRNRGIREIWDAYIARTAPQKLQLSQFFASAQRAGEERRFHYTVDVGEVLKATPEGLTLLPPGTRLRGQKRLTYELCGNPWRQLTEMKLTEYPPQLGPGVLKLDGRFLARQGFPLIRITRQENQIVALAELASWAACWVRMLVSIHLWSFRAPDLAPRREAQLLPSPRPTRLPVPEIRELELEPPRRGVPVRMRLTRYARPGARPIALIHGYSASGSTFTHEAIPRPLALHLWEDGYDVWVLDLRTSAGMPSAVLPWHFEDAALADLPVAFAFIKAATGQPQVDVFAHCIGAVMLSMALLTRPEDLCRFDQVDAGDGGARARRYPEELQALPGTVGRIVLSQKAPTLVYSDANVLRAYFMRLLRHAILPEDYQFEVRGGEHGVAGGLMDRLLSTMPYPDEEFRRENPFWPPWKRTPWAGFRHRMDALYARDFSLGNISGRTLDAIHDLFGPLNLDTVAQAIHFARSNTITDGAGRAIDTQGRTLAERWPRHGTLSLHGADNGLAHVATLDVFEAHMRRAGVPLEVRAIPDYGHQDCLIGRHAARDVFRHISTFLERDHGPATTHVPVADRRPAA